MRAGELRHYITFDAPQATRNEFGEREPTGQAAPSSEGTAHAAIRPTSVREQMAGGTLGQEVTHVITMRHTDRLRADSRIRFGDRTFEVAGIINVDERNVELQVMAKEVT